MNRFVSWFLNVAYVGLLVIFSPIILYRAVAHGKYRQGFRQKFLGLVPELPQLQAPKRRIWFHAVSVGEINLLRPLLAMIREERPDWECVVSTTSLTGMQLAKRLYAADHKVFYCPLDFSWAVFTAIRRIRPNMLVLAEQEIWPNLFYAAKKHGVKLALINGRFGESGYRRYKRFRLFFRPILRMLDVIAVQSETYAGWFHSVGAYGDTIEITGSMKFDGAQTDRNNPKTVQLANLAGINVDSEIVFLAGSTQEPEEEYALDAFEKLKDSWPQLKLILVPRHPERFEAVANLLESRGVDWMRRTQLDSQPDKKGKRVLLVDCVGELGAWWGVSKIAFVGGSMGSRGGQNMLEPAAFG
ncbi:MAG: 3-deoxy-D-manno-octulosonic acid transferase, partial [Planctomycetaceae bacterium]|nr:3-deoxy-D-manno-octulosonic acid transferase [Planctomycetaceae bacterium]